MTSKDYQRLERKIEREEKRKGYSTARASYIAHAAAGKVAREKRARTNPTPARNADGTFKRKAGPRRNPSRKSGPSHDLFGERSHQTGLFGGKVYAAKPAPKKTAAEKKREAKRNAGQTGFDLGLTRGLFG